MSSAHDTARDRPVLVDLDEETCWSLMESAGIGRLAWVDADGPVAVPVNIAVSQGAVVIRTAAYSAMSREIDAPTAWPTGSKSATVRIRPTKITGRRLAAPR